MHFTGIIGADSEGEGMGSTFFLELPLFPKLSAMGASDRSRSRSRHILPSFKRKESFSIRSVGAHPKGSGMNSNISLADLVSLDRKIRCRAGSSEFHYNSEVCPSDSQNISERTDGIASDIQDKDDSLKSFESNFTNKKPVFPCKKASEGRVSLTGIFDRDTRVGCASEAEDLEAGFLRKPPGPCLKSRDASVAHLHAIRVLVVDDSMPTRKLMCAVLTRSGYCVQSAEDGVACISLIEQAMQQGGLYNLDDVFDVIILDDHMPRMGGRETAKVLREKGFTGMICGVTGNTTFEDTLRFEAHGATLVLPKPLDLSLFERKVKAFLKL